MDLGFLQEANWPWLLSATAGVSKSHHNWLAKISDYVQEMQNVHAILGFDFRPHFNIYMHLFIVHFGKLMKPFSSSRRKKIFFNLSLKNWLFEVFTYADYEFEVENCILR
ncbi:hypothetical protein BpHYR1_016444 [Brachionus plicatilis]|uniref:Uncharacterized protein n=1 Tax=Brachionus plicatilis TaxID=10195 RepID=A0A3M7PP72_BRAPC|nr:hypothetical protein BpHYR1_016444 [Brachionus plicatilis]